MTGFYERAYNERDKTESGSFAQEYLEPLPRTASRARASHTSTGWCSRCCRPSPLAEVTALAQDAARRRSRVVLATSAAEGRLQVPTEARAPARRWPQRTAAASRAWNDADDNPRADGERRRSRRASRRAGRWPTLGVTIVKFSNGVEAWLKPTDFKNDQVMFTMYATGRHVAGLAGRLSSRRRLPPSTSACPASAGSRRSTSRRCWPASSRRASPFISLVDTRHSRLAQPRRNLETALQLLYARFTAAGRRS